MLKCGILCEFEPKNEHYDRILYKEVSPSASERPIWIREALLRIGKSRRGLESAPIHRKIEARRGRPSWRCHTDIHFGYVYPSIRMKPVEFLQGFPLFSNNRILMTEKKRGPSTIPKCLSLLNTSSLPQKASGGCTEISFRRNLILGPPQNPLHHMDGWRVNKHQE